MRNDLPKWHRYLFGLATALLILAACFGVTQARPQAAPVVTGVSPSSGPTSGGTQVTITGSGFIGATVVDFGTTQAAGFTVGSDTQITAVSPAGTGTVDVTVTVLDVSSVTSSQDQYTYLAAPTVTGVSPQDGPTSGGTQVTVSGSGFMANSSSVVTAVYFGSDKASSYSVSSAGSLSAVAPAEAAGTVDVTVTTAGGTSATSSQDHYTYLAAPTVTGVSPSGGPTSGGTQVTVSGTGFTSATAVYFGSTSAAGFTVGSDTQITAVSPAGTGTVDVTVTTPGGTSATTADDQFTYATATASGGALQPPTVTALSPDGGPAAGGTSVTITGSGFTAGATVDFGTNPATQVTVNSATSITALAPAGSGTVDVRVTTPAGTSATSTADQFTYSTSTASCAAGFPDVVPGYWAYQAITTLHCKGIVAGFPDGNFRPEAPVTRAQFVAMLVRTVGLPTSSGDTSFADVPPSAWYAPYVAAAVRGGIVVGLSPHVFGPNELLTREQMAVMLAKVLGSSAPSASLSRFSDASSIAPWARTAVQRVVGAGIMAGFPDGSFQPLGTSSRAQAAAVISQYLAYAGKS